MISLELSRLPYVDGPWQDPFCLFCDWGILFVRFKCHNGYFQQFLNYWKRDSCSHLWLAFNDFDRQRAMKEYKS